MIQNVNGILVFLVATTIAWFPLHEYWVQRAKHDYEEVGRRRTFGEGVTTLIFWSWVVILGIGALMALQ